MAIAVGAPPTKLGSPKAHQRWGSSVAWSGLFPTVPAARSVEYSVAGFLTLSTFAHPPWLTVNDNKWITVLVHDE